MNFFSLNTFFNKSLKTFFGFLLLTAFFTFTSYEVKAQWDYSVTGSVRKGKKKLEGAIVTLYKGSSIVQQVTTPSNGKFSFKLDQEADYTLTVTKAGHITKKFVFSTRGIPEDRAKEPFGGQDLEVSIFEMPKDPSVVSQVNSILSQPMAKFFYDDKIKEIDFDKNYSQAMRDQLAKLAAVEEDANKKAEEDAKKNAEMEAAIASKYQAAIAKGDGAFGKKDYVTARAAYTEALDIKPGEAYPKGKIVEIEKLLADAAKNAELEADYKAAIAKGDAAMTAKTYDAAKAGYNAALKLKPAEKYPKDKLAEIDKILADLANKDKADKELQAKYDAAIAKADKALAAKTYDAAKAGYNEALGIKSAEKYPKDKIAEIDKILADLASKDKADKELQAKYDAAIAKADKALAGKSYDAAKSSYNEALGLKPAEKYPKDKIAEIDKALADAAKGAEADAKYKAAIAKADAALKAKTYDAAKAGYNEALGVKPAEQYPKDKIAEIDKLLADIANKDKADKELQAKYDAAIAKADKALAAKTYDAAKAGYNEALGIKSGEKYPKDKLAEIDKILADLASKDKADKELQAKYDAAVAKADKALAGKSYDAAKSSYNDALGLKPAEKYPKDKIAEIDKALADAAKGVEADAKYKAAITKADAALKAKTYDAAKAGYNEALGVKPAEQYPKDKIAEIDALIAKELGEKALDEKYKAAIAKGDAALAKKDYTTAKAGYTDATGLKPSEKYPKDKLAEIDKALADAAAKDAAEKDKLAKEKELQAKYDAAIAKADKALAAKTYDAAKAGYNEALGIKSGEKYPKDKIAEIDALLAKEMGAKALDEKYKAAIAKGDGALAKKDYAAAKTGYNDALGLKPAEQYPKDKLAEIDKALADQANAAKGKELDAKYQAAIAKADKAFGSKTYDAAKAGYNEALGIKPNEKYPKDKLAEIDKALADQANAAKGKELDAKYQAAISKADAALKAKTYDAAKSGYNEALGIKPGEQYPKDKLAEIDKALADQANAAKNKELDAKYQAAITKADAALKAKTYDAAKTGYNEALGIKPGEQYPKDKLAEIDKALAAVASKEAAAAKKVDDKYNEVIAKADAAFTAKDYTAAKTSYNEALGIKPAEKYPKDKIAAIDALIASEANAKEIDAKYKAAILKGDGAFGGKDYTTAKNLYAEAASLKAGEQYPKDQLAKIEKFAAEDAKNKAIQTSYLTAISKGDAAFTAKDYPTALAAYKEAQSVKPSEPYPTNKITEVNRLIDDLARAKGKEQQYKDLIAKADKFFAAKDYKQARSAYQDALLAKATEKYPKDKIAEIDALTNKKAPPPVVTPTNKDDFRNELAKKYPEGITEETATESNAKVIRRIVVHGTEGHLYIQKITSFGPIYYFKDDVPITEKEFIQDTEVVNK